MSALALRSFAFEGDTLRAVDNDGERWLVAQDVCSFLEIAKPRDVLANLEPDERASTSVDTPGGVQRMTIISEAGFYTLALRCRQAMKPGTRPYRFRKFVTGEVIPSIRRTGQYTLPANDRQAEDPVNEALPPEETNLRLAVIRAGTAIWSRAELRKMWRILGLPTPDQALVPLVPAQMGQVSIERVNDPSVARWLDECVVTDPSAPRLRSSELFEAYRAWCETVDEQPATMTTFGRSLSAAGVPTMVSDGVWRLGVRLVGLGNES